MNNRVKQAVKKNHWILRFAFMNLPIIAATMILSKHLKLDLKCLGESECLILSMVAIRISKVGCQKVTKNRVKQDTPET
jgi:uncharacterized membrane protein YhdT